MRKALARTVPALALFASMLALPQEPPEARAQPGPDVTVDGHAAAAAGGIEDRIQWTPLGPRPIDEASKGLNANRAGLGSPPWSGRVTALAAGGGRVFLGAADGGVWVTDDQGASWTPVFDAEASLSIGALAVDPQKPSTVLVGTGEANDSADTYYGAGIFKSTDGGSPGTWIKLDGHTFDDCGIADIAVDPQNSNNVLAAVNNAIGVHGRTSCANRVGIYQSLDGGAHWTRRRPEPATDLSVGAFDGTTWYAGLRGSGVWKSTNSGASWVKLGDLPDTGLRRVAVAQSPLDPTRVYAAFASSQDGTLLGLFVSSDGGAHWDPITTPPDVCGTSCFYTLTLAVDRLDKDVMYFGGTHLYRFDDAGASFHLLGSGPNGIHVDVHALMFTAGQLWIGNDGGVVRTADAGDTFVNISGDLQTTQFYHGISATPGAKTIIGGNHDNGVVKFTGASDWQEILGGDGASTVVDPHNPSVIYGSLLHAQIAKSTDGGAHFSFVFGPKSAAPAVAPLVMDPSHSQRLYVGTDAVYRTTTGGNSEEEWKRISPHFSHPITAIDVSTSGRGAAPVLYAGDKEGFVHVSGDGGTSWHTQGQGLPDNRVVTDVAVDPRNARRAYLSVSGFDRGHLFRTTDRGTNWEDISGDPPNTLPNAPANALALDPRLNPPRLYVGTDAGVLTSGNSGRTWKRYGSGLPNSVVTDVLVDTRSNRLIAATHGRGMFAAQLIHPRADLRADYRFQDTLASSVGSPPKLKRIGPRSNRFVNDTVAGPSRHVLSFPAGNGLALAPTTGLVHPTAYSIVLLARLDDTSGFERLVDFSGGASDRGLYSVNGRLAFWPRALGPDAMSEAKYAQIAITRNVDGEVVGYLNGKVQFRFVDSEGDALVSKDSFRFFRDDTQNPDENSAGRVARIRVFRGALTPRQVADLTKL